MAVTFNAPLPLGDGSWLLTWTSDEVSPTYRIYVDGVLASTQTAAEFLLAAPGDSVPVVEVLDAADQVAEPAHPAYLTLFWLPDADAASYRIEEDVDSVWTERRALLNDGRAYYAWSTPTLPDETVASWRVVPVDAAGNDGTALEFSALIVRHPDPPAVDFSYDSGDGKVTIAAA